MQFSDSDFWSELRERIVKSPHLLPGSVCSLRCVVCAVAGITVGRNVEIRQESMISNRRIASSGMVDLLSDTHHDINVMMGSDSNGNLLSYRTSDAKLISFASCKKPYKIGHFRDA